ncbi:MAG: urea ABC transporter permease subunit UrtB [SAR324 cluster bacterium]|nr:urea ABC transporter permease subunit UrtB [SAR324 cluster bacterium]
MQIARLWQYFILLPGFLFFFVSLVQADEQDDILHGLVSESRTTIKETIDKIAEINDGFFLPVLQALKDRRLFLTPEGLVLIQDETSSTNFLDPKTGQSFKLESSDSFSSPAINNSVRRAIAPVIAQLQLVSPNIEERLKAAQELVEKNNPDAVDALKKALTVEKDRQVRDVMTLALALNEMKSDDKFTRINALKTIGESGDRRSKSLLEPLLEQTGEGQWTEPDADIREAVNKSLSAINSRLMLYEMAGNLFRGISLGSILLLVSLGLAITFGLMKIINMAHGEMLMLGAYSTYVIQNFFHQYLPDWFSWYLLAAIPTAFMVSALTGVLMERLVVRFLYGRPLETLLATWGLSLLLIQTVRLIFGAQNVEVANPEWVSGGIHVSQGLVLPYNRIVIIVFVIMVVTAVWYLFQHTELGLKVRAVTQNRQMASCVGISSSKIDAWTFGLGSGVAGLGGLALSQIGNVNPELGQGYIVDSFMVVVLGGVGKLIGTILSAMGLGVISKFMEPLTGAVSAKILMLIFIILFIQKRPQGMFALKGRAADE